MSSAPEQELAVLCNEGVQRDDAGLSIADDIAHECAEIHARRTSNMWFAAAYNITAIIGVGVLGLPHAMVFLTWPGGVVVLVLAFAMTFFTIGQLIDLHEIGIQGVRYGTYHDLGELAYPRWGRCIVIPLQMIVEVSLDVLFTVAAGEAMNRIFDKVLPGSDPVHLFVWFTVFAVIQMFLCIYAPDFDAIKWIVVFAAIMSVGYSSIAWITIVSMFDDKEDVHYGLPHRLTVDHDVIHEASLELTTMDLVFRAFNAIGVVAFAYAAHNVVLEIQNGIPSTPERPSKVEMFRGVLVTYLVVALCYFPMAIAVYQRRGDRISQNVLSFMQYHANAPTALVIIINIMLILHLIGSYQVFAQPVFKFLEEDLFNIRFRRSHFKRISVRFLYIVFATALAMIFPHFSPLLGFFGGFAIAPTTYFLPCFLWLELKRPRRWTWEWSLNWACIILGVLLMIVASVGGAYVFVTAVDKRDDWILWTSKWKSSLLYSTKNILDIGSSCRDRLPSPPF